MSAQWEELRKNVRDLLDRCDDPKEWKEGYEDLKKEVLARIDEIKKHKEESEEWEEYAEKLHEKIISFMKEDLKALQGLALEAVKASMEEKTLQEAKVALLGKKGKMTAILRSMKDLSAEERPVMGALANEMRDYIEKLIEEKRQELKAKRLAEQIAEEAVDITLPARQLPTGHIHPLEKALRVIMDTFVRMGYSVEEGPEIEKDYYNFYCLNLPADHPARDMQDSFYLTPEILLRTHTSPVQARTLQSRDPNTPIRMIAPGKVFRWDNDATHSPVFHQVEGLVVDKGVKFSDLKGTLEVFLKELFGSDTRIRFRASYFPFTEPSAEVDISFASRTREGGEDPNWLEILGCGMVHPNVLRLNNYDPDVVSGFAFGMGVERIAMLLYGINDLRLFYENDVRFLRQF